MSNSLEDPSDSPNTSSDSPSPVAQYDVGYRKPPKHSQFSKGRSGNPNGRPKQAVGVSIKDILDGDQLGKNGEIISKREAIVIRMLNDAMAGNQKAFARFLKLLKLCGLKRSEPSLSVATVYYEPKIPNPEQYEKIMRELAAKGLVKERHK